MCPTTLLEGVGLRISNRSALILLVCVLGVSTSVAESAKSLYHKGQVAEAKQDYLEAYAAYKAAYDEKPTDLRYRSAFERLKFQAAAVHVKRGQQLRQRGDLQKALQEFQTAAQIDPSSFIAQQEIARTQAQISGAAGGGNTTQQEPKREDILRQRTGQAQGPVSLAPINDLSINMHISGDSKTIYQTIGKLAGINILFDPDYVARQLPPLELNGVTLQEALGIVSIQSGTFWRPVTPNTIFVAPNTQTKRKDLDQSVVKTFYLTNAASQTEFQDIANTLRTILDITRVQPIAAENAIVVRGSPDKVALAEKIVADLDKSRAEVVIDVAILQVSKERIRNLGFTPSLANGPIGIQLIPPGQTTTTNPNATTNGQSSSTTTTNNGLTLNTFKNWNATDVALSLPQAQLNALLNDSDTKLLQNPEIRASDGQKASLKIGSRIPIATGSFQPGIGGVGINPLVNTQFQYLDVGVNIDVQPTVHFHADVTLKTTMDISSVTSFQNIGGIQQPVIGQRKIEHVVRLREGEANLMGGMLEDSQTKNLTGIPGLAQIPLLKYLFGQTTVEHSQTETVFVLIPHIVRRQVLTTTNQAAIDVGTASAIGLRRVSPSASAVTTTSSPATGPSSGAGSVNVPQPAPATSSMPTPQLMERSATFTFDPASSVQHVGSTFTVNVLLSGGQNIFQVPMQISYDPKLLQVANVSNGSFLSQDGQIVTVTHREDDGTMQVTATRPPGSPGISGQGAVVTLTFVAKAPGQASLTIAKGGARDPAMQALPVNGASAAVTIQ